MIGKKLLETRISKKIIFWITLLLFILLMALGASLFGYLNTKSRTRTHEYGFFFYIITPTHPTAYAEHYAGGLFLCPSQESYPHFSSPHQAL